MSRGNGGLSSFPTMQCSVVLVLIWGRYCIQLAGRECQITSPSLTAASPSKHVSTVQGKSTHPSNAMQIVHEKLGWAGGLGRLRTGTTLQPSRLPTVWLFLASRKHLLYTGTVFLFCSIKGVPLPILVHYISSGYYILFLMSQTPLHMLVLLKFFYQQLCCLLLK